MTAPIATPLYVEICFPIKITSENNTIVMLESGVRYEVTVPAGVYYNHKVATAGYTGSAWQSTELLNVVANRMTATLVRSYFRLQNTDVTRPLTHRIYTSHSPAPSFNYAFDDAAFTFDKRILGYPSDRTGFASSSGAYLPAEISPFGSALFVDDFSSKKYGLARFPAFKDVRLMEWRNETQRSMHKSGAGPSPYASVYNTHTKRILEIAGLPKEHVYPGGTNALYDLWQNADADGIAEPNCLRVSTGYLRRTGFAQTRLLEAARIVDVAALLDFSRLAQEEPEFSGERYRVRIPLTLV